jgi:signal recognition particle subunit SRP54
MMSQMAAGGGGMPGMPGMPGMGKRTKGKQPAKKGRVKRQSGNPAKRALAAKQSSAQQPAEDVPFELPKDLKGLL